MYVIYLKLKFMLYCITCDSDTLYTIVYNCIQLYTIYCIQNFARIRCFGL